MPAQATVDADVLAAVALACPAVAALHLGGTRFVATYFAGRRVVGVRVDEERVLLSVVLARGASVETLEKQVRGSLASLVGGRAIDVHVADVETGVHTVSDMAEEPG